MKKNEKIEFIQAVIDFCAFDLTNITPPDDPQTSIFKFLHDSLPEIPIHAIIQMYVPLIDWSLLISGQKQIRDFLNWFVDLEVDSYRLEFDVPHHFSYGGSDPSDRVFLYTQSFWEEGDTPKILKIKVQIRNKDEIERKIMSVPIGIVNFFQALDQFHAHSLLRCPQCNNIFFNPTRRKKIYCSLRCQNTAAVQRLRKKEVRNHNQH